MEHLEAHNPTLSTQASLSAPGDVVPVTELRNRGYVHRLLITWRILFPATAITSENHAGGGATSRNVFKRVQAAASVGRRWSLALAVRRFRRFSDIDIERRRLHTRSQPRHPGPEAIARLDLYAAAAANRGIGALTTRRVLELSAATDPQSTLALLQLLEHHRPNNFRPPLSDIEFGSAARGVRLLSQIERPRAHAAPTTVASGGRAGASR